MTKNEQLNIDADFNSEKVENEAHLISYKSKIKNILILFCSGMLFAAAFPPFNLSFIAWFGLIPLYFIVHNMTKWQAFRGGYIWGLGWSLFAFMWLREIEWIAPILLSFCFLAFFPAFWTFFIPILKRTFLIPLETQLLGYREICKYHEKSILKQILFICALSSLWCILEWIRSWIFTGLPWNFLSVTQWKNIPLIQCVEYTGTYGVSFLIVALNIGCVLTIQIWKYNFFKHKKYQRPFALIFVILLIVFAIFIGHFGKTKNQGDTTKLKVATIQGNIEQCRFATLEQALNALKTYIELGEIASYLKPDIVIFPETAVPYPYMGNYTYSQSYRQQLSNIIIKNQQSFLIGTLEINPQTEQMYNIALLLDKNAKPLDKYAKIHRVPFGEFVPLRQFIPDFIVKMIDMGRELSVGTSYKPIQIKENVFAGINICFEDVFPYISKNEVRNGANIIIVLTNDAWYPHSSESEQHLANSIFRAIETRINIIRCGNDSGSCLIQPTGEISNNDMIANPKKKSKGILTLEVDVPKNITKTFYTKYGDVFILLCIISFLFAFIKYLYIWREIKRNFNTLEPVTNAK